MRHLKVLQLLGSPIIVTVLPFPVLDLSQAPFKANLIALLGWVIILMPHEISRHRFHRSHFSRRIMRVLIIFAIAQFFHEFGGSIANLQRYWLISRFFNICLSCCEDVITWGIAFFISHIKADLVKFIQVSIDFYQATQVALWIRSFKVL